MKSTAIPYLFALVTARSNGIQLAAGYALGLVASKLGLVDDVLSGATRDQGTNTRAVVAPRARNAANVWADVAGTPTPESWMIETCDVEADAIGAAAAAEATVAIPIVSAVILRRSTDCGRSLGIVRITGSRARSCG
jgi:hypothetical protein